MRVPTRSALALLAGAALLAPLAEVAGASTPPPPPAVIPHQTLHFAVNVGPAGTLHCDVVADLYTPPGVDAAHRAPAILTTNGFGGSKDDQAGIAQQFGRAGYVVLSYSGLGFGGSGCPIELDDPDYDGKAGSQLIDFLGGKSGNAFLDAAHTQPVAAPNDVIRDDLAGRRASDGRSHRYDPRVGMIGGSYGGEVQFAVAKDDPRLDTIIPQITWNDLGYSLAPNNAENTVGVTSPVSNPGTEKQEWTTLFFGLGIVDGVQGASADPSRLQTGCPNFNASACPAKAEMDTLGYPDASTYAFAHHASVGSYLSAIRIPTLLSQGQADTLFTLRESVATYHALQRAGVPVRMIWQEWGHSGGAAPGEDDTSASASATDTYDQARYLNWFDHWLKGTNAPLGAPLAYFADWIPAGALGLNDPRYLTASGPDTAPTRLLLSGTGDLVRSARAVVAGSPSLTVTGGPSSYTETSALDQSHAVTDAPGTIASFSTAPLQTAATLVGFPRLTVQLNAPGYALTQSTPGGQLVLFAKLYDVAPDGTITLTHRLISPFRVADVTKPVTITLPGVVHQVPAGHRLELVLAGGDSAYKEGAPGTVSVVNDPSAPNVLSLPVIGQLG